MTTDQHRAAVVADTSTQTASSKGHARIGPGVGAVVWQVPAHAVAPRLLLTYAPGTVAVVVAVGTPATMPARPYSGLVIGGLWPASDPQSWAQKAAVLRQNAHELLNTAEGIRHRTDGVLAERQSGQAIDGFAEACYRKAHTVTSHADDYFAAANAAEETGRLLDGLCHDLDDIDHEANQKIQHIQASAGNGFGAAAKIAMINAIVADAHTQATEQHAITATTITTHTTHTTNITG